MKPFFYLQYASIRIKPESDVIQILAYADVHHFRKVSIKICENLIQLLTLSSVSC